MENTLMVAVFAVGAVTIAVVLAALSIRRRVLSVGHLQEFCDVVGALREAAMAFPSRIENGDLSPGEQATEQTSASVRITYKVFLTSLGSVHVLSFSLNRSVWPGKRRAAGQFFGVLEDYLALRDCSRGWANPAAQMYYLVYQKTGDAAGDEPIGDKPTPERIQEIKRLGLTAPGEASVVYLSPGDPPSSAEPTNNLSDRIRRALSR